MITWLQIIKFELYPLAVTLFKTHNCCTFLGNVSNISNSVLFTYVCTHIPTYMCMRVHAHIVINDCTNI
jgi:hypothetical protein